jgi:leucine dehydrogenase
MGVFSHPDYQGHEGVFFHHDPATGLKCIVAVHSTARGSACGGCRMWNYESDEEAITDVLRLSRGMSFKNAVSDLALGGGKSVIIGNPKTDKTPELFRAFGRFVNTLGGIYITAEDVGISPEDMEHVRQETRFVAGLEKIGRAPSGDPSPFTAYGVFEGIKRLVQYRLKRDGLKGTKVAIQGLGHVGLRLAERLHGDGAELYVSDIDEKACREAEERFGAKAVGLDEIYDVPADVYAPCALGGTVNEQTVPRLKATIIAGAANNQLASAAVGGLLQKRGIAYAPDYVINCGGIINVEGEIYGAYDPDAVRLKIRATIDRLVEIVAQSDREGEPAGAIADRYALAMLDKPAAPPKVWPHSAADRSERRLAAE